MPKKDESKKIMNCQVFFLEKKEKTKKKNFKKWEKCKNAGKKIVVSKERIIIFVALLVNKK